MCSDKNVCQKNGRTIQVMHGKLGLQVTCIRFIKLVKDKHLMIAYKIDWVMELNKVDKYTIHVDPNGLKIKTQHCEYRVK